MILLPNPKSLPICIMAAVRIIVFFSEDRLFDTGRHLGLWENARLDQEWRREGSNPTCAVFTISL